jgi:uncharacterized alkaline shock family protein YloU
MARKKQGADQKTHEALVPMSEQDDDSYGNGKVTIAPEVLLSIARLAALQVPGVSRMSPVSGGVNRFFRKGYSEGVRVEIEGDNVTTDLYIVVNNDVNLRDTSRNIQREVCRAISEMVGMSVARVNIHIEDIDFPTEPES